MIAADKPVAFRSASGMLIGVVGLVVLLLLCGFGFADSDVKGRLVSLGLALLVGGAIWATLIRPALIFRPESLLLRNILDEVELPWTAVDEIQVRSMAVVHSGSQRYTCVGLSRSRRSMVAPSKNPRTSVADQAAEFGTEKGRHARESSTEAEVAASYGQVRRTRAWWLVAVIIAGAVLFVAGLLL